MLDYEKYRDFELLELPGSDFFPRPPCDYLVFGGQDACFNVREFCQTVAASYAQRMEFSDRWWWILTSKDFPDINMNYGNFIASLLKNISINDFQTLYLNIFNTTCAHMQSDTYYSDRLYAKSIKDCWGSTFLAKLPQNNSVFLSTSIAGAKCGRGCHHLNQSSDYISLSSRLFYCNPIDVANLLTPPIRKMVLGTVCGISVATASWLGLVSVYLW